MNKRIKKKLYIKKMSKIDDGDETFARELYKVRSLRKQLEKLNREIDKLRKVEEKYFGLY